MTKNKSRNISIKKSVQYIKDRRTVVTSKYGFAYFSSLLPDIRQSLLGPYMEFQAVQSRHWNSHLSIWGEEETPGMWAILWGGLIVNRIKFSASFRFDPDGRFSKSHTGLQDCFLIISYILCFIENIHSFWHLESLLFLQVVYWALNTRRYLFRHVSTGKYE